MMALKILSLIITALGAVIALFGKTFKDKRLTKTGILALVVIAIGLLASITLEVKAQKQQSIEDQWSMTMEQHLYELHLRFYCRPLMPLYQFTRLMKDIRFTFVTYASLNAEVPKRRCVEFKDFPYGIQEGDLDQEFMLNCNSDKGLIAQGQSSWFLLRRVYYEGRVEVVGIDIIFPYRGLDLGDALVTVGDIVKLTSLHITLPSYINLDEVDCFCLSFITSDDQSLSLDLRKLTFNRIGREATITEAIDGVAILEHLKDDFQKHGGRSPY